MIHHGGRDAAAAPPGQSAAQTEIGIVAVGEQIGVEQADVADLPFADASVDLVVSSLSLHHWDRPREAIGELGRVLRPGGRLRIYDFPFAPFDELESAARDRS